MDKLYFNCIGEKLSTRCYMIIFIVIECILFPSITIFCRMSYLAAIILMILLQAVECGIIIYLRPFLSKIENASIIIEQVMFLIAFFLTLVLSLLLEQDTSREMNYSSSI